MQILGGLGIGSLVFQRQVAAQVAAKVEVTTAMLAEAEWVAGITLTDGERKTIAKTLTRTQERIAKLRTISIDYRVSPAFYFAPRAPQNSTTKSENLGAQRESPSEGIKRPESDSHLAFLPVTELAELIRTRKVTSMELTRLYLARLKQYDPVLNCVVTYTEDLAVRQAERADAEISAGKYRGLLHGIPWGAKDLIAYPGYRTTWGAAHYKNQQLDHKATIAEKLEDAGAVLVAKLTLGALAEGDRWFGGMTRNPFDFEQGSSGSSAGSASAVSAGLVGFAIGSETLGSIVSPCSRCRATGLRPTFGRVSRYGCMPLSWTMDKLGPIARSVEDCAVVFSAIHGSDSKDPSAQTSDFQWPFSSKLDEMRVGYFENTAADVLDRLRELNVRLVPIELPGRELAARISYILSVEASAVFDEVTLDGVSDGHGFNRWTERFPRMRFVSAVDYLRANRLRSMLMDDVARATTGVDAWVGGDDLTVTNLTGHPTVVLPHGSPDRRGEGDKQSVTLTGQPFADDSLLGLAAAFQRLGDAHLQRPVL